MDNNIIDLPGVNLLKEKETKNYIKKAQHGNSKALNKLIKHNLRLVLKMTYRFKNSKYDLQDLFQIGVIGLIKAVKGFDLERNVKFSTYAVSRILGEIKLFMRDEGIIKVSRNLKKIGRIVRKREEEYKKKYGRAPTINEISEITGFTKQKIIRAMEANKYPTSINKEIYEKEGQKLYLVDSIEDEEARDKIENLDRVTLYNLIQNLEKRERKIIYLRYFEDKTQAEIGKEIGVSQVQVSRLIKKILAELRKKINTQ